MKRLGMLFGFVAILAASGCSGSGGNGGGGSKGSDLQGNYYTQFFSDYTNLFPPNPDGSPNGFGDAGLLPIDVFAEDNGLTFGGIDISIEKGEVKGDVVTWTRGDDTTEVKLVYKVKLTEKEGRLFQDGDEGDLDWDPATQEGGGLTITYNTWSCDGVPCYFHYDPHGPRVSPDWENPKILTEESSVAMTAEDAAVMVLERLPPRNIHKLEALQEKFRERFGTAWQER